MLDLRPDSVERKFEAALAVLNFFLEGFYDLRRRHTALGFISPAEFEWQTGPPFYVLSTTVYGIKQLRNTGCLDWGQHDKTEYIRYARHASISCRCRGD